MSLSTTFKGFAGNGYAHPALRRAFDDLAGSERFGMPMLRFCHDAAYPIDADDTLREQFNHGICTPERISVLPDSDYRTLAHEMRHGFQMRQLDVFWYALDNPLSRHVMKRMVEADAFTYEDIVTMDRWYGMGYKTKNDIPADEQASEPALIYLSDYVAHHDNPQKIAMLMRGIFDHYYKEIGINPLYASYEANSMIDSAFHYRELFLRLIDPANYPSEEDQERTLALISAFHTGTDAVRSMGAKLGTIPNLPVNYLTQTPGRELGDYVGPFSQDILEYHVNWEDRIKIEIEKRFNLGL